MTDNVTEEESPDPDNRHRSVEIMEVLGQEVVVGKVDNCIICNSPDRVTVESLRWLGYTIPQTIRALSSDSPVLTTRDGTGRPVCKKTILSRFHRHEHPETGHNAITAAQAKAIREAAAEIAGDGISEEIVSGITLIKEGLTRAYQDMQKGRMTFKPSDVARFAELDLKLTSEMDGGYAKVFQEGIVAFIAAVRKYVPEETMPFLMADIQADPAIVAAFQALQKVESEQRSIGP